MSKKLEKTSLSPRFMVQSIFLKYPGFLLSVSQLRAKVLEHHGESIKASTVRGAIFEIKKSGLTIHIHRVRAGAKKILINFYSYQK